MQAQLDVFRPPPFSAHMAAHNERFTQVPQSARSAKDDSTVVAASLAVVNFRVETEKETAGKADKPYQATKLPSLKNTKNEE